MLFQNQFAKIDFHRLLTPSFHSSLFFVNRLAARVMQQAQKADRNMHRAKPSTLLNRVGATMLGT